MAVVVGLLLVTWSMLVVIGRLRPAFGLSRLWLLILLFLIPICWAVLQSLSLTPEAWHHPLWQSAAEALDMQLIPRSDNRDP
jgi:cytochrome c oxidase assembly factor CtaG